MSTLGNVGIGAGGGPLLPTDTSVGSESQTQLRTPSEKKRSMHVRTDLLTNSTFSIDSSTRHRLCFTRQPKRYFVFPVGDFGYHLQERQVVAEPKRGRDSWQHVLPSSH
jgi:hypothetical protein